MQLYRASFTFGCLGKPRGDKMLTRRRARPDDAGGLNVNPPSPISNEYLEARRQESSAECDCQHRAMAAQVYTEIMQDDLFPIPSPRVDQPDNQGPEGNTP